MRHNSNEGYEFGSFTLEVQQQRLKKGSIEIDALTPTLFKILHFLVQNAHQRLRKEAIIAVVWPETVVTDDNLTRNISTLRDLLGDDPDHPTYIKTIPRFGYEFIATVTQINPTSHEPGTLPQLEERVDRPDVQLAIPQYDTRRRIGRFIIPMLIALSVISVIGMWWRFREADPHTLRVQIFNCDDECTLFLNNVEVAHTGFAERSGWRDITSQLHPGANELRLRVTNDVGAIAYGLEVERGGLLVVREQCGVAHRVGCNDQQSYPHGIALELVHTFHK